MIVLIILGFLLCIAVGAVGVWLLWRQLAGVDPAKAIFKSKDASIEGPVGFVMVLGALVVALAMLALYEPSVETENKRLTTENSGLKPGIEDNQGPAQRLRD